MSGISRKRVPKPPLDTGGRPLDIPKPIQTEPPSDLERLILNPVRFSVKPTGRWSLGVALGVPAPLDHEHPTAVIEKGDSQETVQNELRFERINTPHDAFSVFRLNIYRGGGEWKPFSQAFVRFSKSTNPSVLFMNPQEGELLYLRRDRTLCLWGRLNDNSTTLTEVPFAPYLISANLFTAPPETYPVLIHDNGLGGTYQLRMTKDAYATSAFLTSNRVFAHPILPQSNNENGSDLFGTGATSVFHQNINNRDKPFYVNKSGYYRLFFFSPSYVSGSPTADTFYQAICLPQSSSFVPIQNELRLNGSLLVYWTGTQWLPIGGIATIRNRTTITQPYPNELAYESDQLYRWTGTQWERLFSSSDRLRYETNRMTSWSGGTAGDVRITGDELFYAIEPHDSGSTKAMIPVHQGMILPPSVWTVRSSETTLTTPPIGFTQGYFWNTTSQYLSFPEGITAYNSRVSATVGMFRPQRGGNMRFFFEMYGQQENDRSNANWAVILEFYSLTSSFVYHTTEITLTANAVITDTTNNRKFLRYSVSTNINLSGNFNRLQYGQSTATTVSGLPLNDRYIVAVQLIRQRGQETAPRPNFYFLNAYCQLYAPLNAIQL